VSHILRILSTLAEALKRNRITGSFGSERNQRVGKVACSTTHTTTFRDGIKKNQDW
jgi:hypothetical protein